MNYLPIPTFIINLKERIDRKVNVLQQFKARQEFTIDVVEAQEHAIGTLHKCAVNKVELFVKIIIVFKVTYIIIHPCKNTFYTLLRFF
jgi:hypothetical protein